MPYNDKTNQRLEVAKSLIDNLPENNKVGIIRFTHKIYTLTPTLTSNKEYAKSFLTTKYFHSYDGTCMYSAVNQALALFESTDDSTLRMVIVLSDGETSDSNMHSSVVTKANNQKVKVHTVGLGGSESSTYTYYMKLLSNNTAGAYYHASNAGELDDIYKDINKKIDMETDSDEDGITDFYEENMVMFNGVKLELKKDSPDSDEDGIPDGEEIEEFNYQYNADKTQVIVNGKLIANPLEVDTDEDGLTDEEEIYYYGTDPLLRDTDGDNFNDCMEVGAWFDPLQPDADGDGILDITEYVQGTSPYVYDTDFDDYKWDFIKDFVLGDIIKDTDSTALVLGQMTGSCIPGIDVRDAIANLCYGDYLFCGLSLVGLIPAGGDGVKAVGKVVKFISKNIDNLPKIVNVLSSVKNIAPELIEYFAKNDEFLDIMKRISKSDTSKLTKKELETLNSFLDDVGLSKYVIKSNTDKIDDILKGLTETTNGKGIAKNFESSGGFEKTIQDFDLLNPINVKDIQTKYGPGKVGKLSDGTTVVARPGSTTGGATLEIKVSNSKVYKI